MLCPRSGRVKSGRCASGGPRARTTARRTLHYNAAAMETPSACDTILETIGHTPLVRIRRMNPEQQASVVEGWFSDGMHESHARYPVVRDSIRGGR